MATKTFEELKQMAIQIRDEKTNKQNTATRIGTQMLEHLNKLEQDFLDKETTEDKFFELEKLNFNFLQSTTFPSITQDGNNVTISSHIYLFIGKPLIYINMPSKTINLGTPTDGIKNIVLLEIDEYKGTSGSTEADTFCRYVVANGSLSSLDSNKYYLPLFYYDTNYKIYYLNKVIRDFESLYNISHKIGNLGILNIANSILTKEITVSEKYTDDEGFDRVNVTIPDVFPDASVLDIYTGEYNYGSKIISGTYAVPYAYGMLALCCNYGTYRVESFSLQAMSSDPLYFKNKYLTLEGYSITPLVLIYKGAIVYNALLNINKRYENDLEEVKNTHNKDVSSVNSTLENLISTEKIDLVFKQGYVAGGSVDFEVKSSTSWVYTVIPIENLFSIKTFAGGSANTTGLFAVHFMREEELIVDNYISSYSSSDGGNSILLNSFNLKDIEKPQEAKYIVINCYATNKEEAEVYSQLYASQYVIQKIKEIEGAIGETPIHNTFTVRKTPNSGEYGTIQEALNQAKEYDSIIIYEGVYEEQHLHIPQGLKMEGIGKVEIRGKYPENTDVTTVTANSTLECNKGATLKNLIVTAQNMRYPIHADFSNGAKANWDIRNCKFIHYGNKEVYDYMTSQGQETNGTLFTACSAWGGGTYGGDTVYCEDCYFESVGRAFSTHNNTGATYTNIGPSRVKLVNCELVSKGIDIDGTPAGLLASLFVQSLDCPVECEVILSNCKINGYIVRQSSGGDGWSNILKLYSCGNQKIAFSSYGSGQKSLKEGNQTSTYQSHYDKYNIDDSINSFINIGDSVINKGQAVKRTSYGIAKLTSQDEEPLFGIALDDIQINECGNIKETIGYIHRIYLDGLRTTDLSEGTDIYLTETGGFSKTGSVKVLTAVDNQNCIFVE